MADIEKLFTRILKDESIEDEAKKELRAFWKKHKKTLKELGMERLHVVLARFRDDKKSAAKELMKDLTWEETLAVYRGATSKLDGINRRRKARAELWSDFKSVAVSILLKAIVAAL